MPESFEVDFDSVEYSYDGVTLALRGITMHIPEGKIVGMLGPSGSGKTTISQILLGLREPTSGRATIGGEDAAAISKSDAHNTVALVPQEPVLLQGSIMDNIKFFRDFEDERGHRRRAGRHTCTRTSSGCPPVTRLPWVRVAAPCRAGRSSASPSHVR